MTTPRLRQRLLALLVALAALVALEVSLRALGYGQDLALFVPLPARGASARYLGINPEIARRYFPKHHFLPRPTSDRFLAEKPAGSFRVFVLGESSAAGWPFPNNVMFSRLLERRLARALPTRPLEVINVAMAAVNSYTLRDLVDEVLAERPDAILVYAGHNEYYGALGAGSKVSLGDSDVLIRAHLALQRWRLVQLVQDALAGAGRALRGQPAEPAYPTLMGQVVGEGAILLGDEVYARGVAQFRRNVGALLERAALAGVPVLLGELVSNVRDHAPFRALVDGVPTPALEAFRRARELEAAGEMEAAAREYERAKEQDGLRYRAPEELNSVLRELARVHGVALVPLKTRFEAAATNGLVGDELMLEHLHPNSAGQRLMGQAFFDALVERGLVPALDGEDDGFPGFTELDVALADVRVLHLSDHWPFKPEAEFSDAVRKLVPKSRAEALAKAVFLGDVGFREAHARLADEHEERGRPDLALREWRALVSAAPLDPEGHLRAAWWCLRARRVDDALPFLESARRIALGSAPAIAPLQPRAGATSSIERARATLAELRRIDPEQKGLLEVESALE